MNILTISNLMEKDDFEETIQLLIEEGTCKTEKAAWKYIQKARKTSEYQAELLLHIMLEKQNEKNVDKPTIKTATAPFLAWH